MKNPNRKGVFSKFNLIFRFSCAFSFSLYKKKKRRRRRREKKVMQKHHKHQKNNRFFFPNCVFFWNFCTFFYDGFYWKSAFQCKMPFRPHWWVEIFLRKKIDFRFGVFTLLMPKNDLFSIFRPPLFSGRRLDFFFVISLKFLHRKQLSGLVAPISADLMIPSFFEK